MFLVSEIFELKKASFFKKKSYFWVNYAIYRLVS